jgi:hypothetical protein
VDFEVRKPVAYSVGVRTSIRRDFLWETMVVASLLECREVTRGPDASV